MTRRGESRELCWDKIFSICQFAFARPHSSIQVFSRRRRRASRILFHEGRAASSHLAPARMFLLAKLVGDSENLLATLLLPRRGADRRGRERESGRAGRRKTELDGPLFFCRQLILGYADCSWMNFPAQMFVRLARLNYYSSLRRVLRVLLGEVGNQWIWKHDKVGVFPCRASAPQGRSIFFILIKTESRDVLLNGIFKLFGFNARLCDPMLWNSCEPLNS